MHVDTWCACCVAALQRDAAGYPANWARFRQAVLGICERNWPNDTSLSAHQLQAAVRAVNGQDADAALQALQREHELRQQLVQAVAGQERQQVQQLSGKLAQLADEQCIGADISELQELQERWEQQEQSQERLDAMPRTVYDQRAMQEVGRQQGLFRRTEVLEPNKLLGSALTAPHHTAVRAAAAREAAETAAAVAPATTAAEGAAADDAVVSAADTDVAGDGGGNQGSGVSGEQRPTSPSVAATSEHRVPVGVAAATGGGLPGEAPEQQQQQQEQPGVPAQQGSTAQEGRQQQQQQQQQQPPMPPDVASAEEVCVCVCV